MDHDFIRQRHQQLWAEQNKHLQRTLVATLIFAVVALFNILIPYKNNYVERAGLEAQIDSLSALSDQSGVLLQEVDRLDNTLMDVGAIIDTKPWNQKRDDLINEYKRIRNSGGTTLEHQQNIADSTVNDIAEMVQATIYTPLARFLKGDSLADHFMPKTTNDLKALPTILQSWVNSNIKQPWFSTIQSKTATVNELTATLDSHLNSLSENLLAEKDALIEHKKKIALEISALQDQSTVEQKREELKIIQANMTKIIPEWLDGLITLKQLVQLYPVILAVIFFYILWLGTSLSKHYAAFAQSDPSTFKGSSLIASIWTMTDRGRATVLTLIAYLLLMSGLWIFFEQGIATINHCLEIDDKFNKGLEKYMFLAWFIRLAMAGAMLYTALFFQKGAAKSE